MDTEELEQLEPSLGPPPRLPGPRAHDVAQVEQQIAAVRRQAELLRAATIALTLPEDWVLMGDKLYLQNRGCERVAKAWGLEFDAVRPDDFVREDLPGGHVVWSVILSGRCKRTGERKSEIGSRSTVSEFFRGRFEAAEEGSAERNLLVYDAKKSALTNAHGRLTRALTGMSGLPPAQLEQYGFKLGAVPEARFEKGGKGGALRADAATDKQLWKIAALACKDGRVAGLRPSELKRTEAMLGRCRLTGGRGGSASRIIEWLSNAAEPVTMDAFLAEVGYVPEGDSAAETEGAPAAESGDRVAT